ncbi:MAG: YhcH/YjgK/YiaL family protein [Lachnospiraceae bacterium]|nr:YhcH/YjgK/YiaL family protein [Lachnospiraceae bacterium]
MIFDCKENLANYRGLGKNYATAIDFLLNTDLAALEPGKIEIDGKEVYANVLSYETIPWEEAKYEAHEHYTDIQYMITGNEVMTYAPKKNLIPKNEYNPVKDVINYTNDVRGIDLLTPPDMYAIFLPQDAHKVKSMADKPEVIKKIVVKIKID